MVNTKTTNKLKPLTVKIPEEIHTEFKTKTASNRETMAAVIMRCIKKYLSK